MAYWQRTGLQDNHINALNQEVGGEMAEKKIVDMPLSEVRAHISDRAQELANLMQTLHIGMFEVKVRGGHIITIGLEKREMPTGE